MDSMRIVGDSVLVEMNADRIERITTNGAPATFWQQRDTTERDTTAAANTIVYLPDSGLLELSGSASLKQDGNEVSSALIRYDLALGQLDAAALMLGRACTYEVKGAYQSAPNDPPKSHDASRYCVKKKLQRRFSC